MPNLSLPGPLAAFIAFGRAKVWPTFLLLGLIFSPLAASASCETDVANGTAMAARFVDFAKLETLSDDFIAQELVKQDTLLVNENAERMKLSALYHAKFAEVGHRANVADIKAAGLDLLHDKMELADASVLAIENFKEALHRVRARRQSGVSAAKAIAPLKIEINVHGKSQREVLNEIVAKLRTLNRPLDQLVLRYFADARHDLTALHGTDNFGTESNHRALFDEQQMLTGVLKELNLQRDDGFHGASPEFFFHHHDDPEKIGDGIGRIADFMRGEQAISVYDAGDLHDYDADFYVFRVPAEKVKAVRALLLPVDR